MHSFLTWSQLGHQLRGAEVWRSWIDGEGGTLAQPGGATQGVVLGRTQQQYVPIGISPSLELGPTKSGEICEGR